MKLFRCNFSDCVESSRNGAAFGNDCLFKGEQLRDRNTFRGIEAGLVAGKGLETFSSLNSQTSNLRTMASASKGG